MTDRYSAFRALAAGLAAFSLLAQAPAAELISGVKENGRIALSETPWTPPAPSRVEPKVIYGPDDRIDLYAETDPVRIQLAKSVCAVINASRVVNNGNGTFTIQTGAYTVGGKPACPGEAFASQPTASFCTGFLVGDDLLVTAGHCFNNTDLVNGNTRFVFGWTMANSTTPVTVVPAENVYTGVQLLAWQDTSTSDYALIRLDRAVTASGAIPLEIRRTGTIANDTPIGVIGHPWGLPLKIAFGSTTRVRDNSPATHFVANLDTYGGNSGSPVFNQLTGLVEGILVRGATDFVDTGSCFVSNQLPDNQGGEDAQKITAIAALIPELSASITLDKVIYGASQTVAITVRDAAAGAGPLSVTVVTGGGDSETVSLPSTGSNNTFAGTLLIGASGEGVATGDGTLQALNGDTLTATYVGAVTRTANANIDLLPPVVSAPSITGVTAGGFTVGYTTNEPTTTQVRAGFVCGSFFAVASAPLSSAPSVTLGSLAEATTYLFEVVVADAAGNSVTLRAPNGGCFQQTTRALGAPIFADNFDPSALAGWTVQVVQGTGNWAVQSSGNAHSSPNVYRFTSATEGNASIRLVSPPIAGGDLLEFHHSYQVEASYDGCFLEVSTDNGTTWSSLGPHISTGAYNSSIFSSASSVDAGSSCWTGGTLGTPTRVEADLAAFPGSKRIGFRFSSDSSVASVGWLIDSVRVLPVQIVPEPLAAGEHWILFE